MNPSDSLWGRCVSAGAQPGPVLNIGDGLGRMQLLQVCCTQCAVGLRSFDAKSGFLG